MRGKHEKKLPQLELNIDDFIIPEHKILMTRFQDYKIKSATEQILTLHIFNFLAATTPWSFSHVLNRIDILYCSFAALSLLHPLCWNTSIYSIWLGIFSHNGACTNNTTLCNFYSWHNNGSSTNPTIITNNNSFFFKRSLLNHRNISS